MIVRKRLPFSFAPEPLQLDFEAIPKPTYWNIYNPYLEPDTLFGIDLIEPEFVPKLDRTPEFRPNKRLQSLKSFLHVFNTIQSPMELMRVHTLAPGASIRPHRDVGRCFENGVFRIHVPICTSPKVETIHNGETVFMAPGECWYLNFDLQHEIHNRSDQWRAHLIMDCQRNPWWESILLAA